MRILILVSFIISSIFNIALKGQDLLFYEDVLNTAHHSEFRKMANDSFQLKFERALNSDRLFTRAWDLLATSILYAPDSSFRIATWQYEGAQEFHTFGYFQPKGAPSIALNDQAKYLWTQEYGELFADRWLGTVYTAMHPIPGLDSVYLLMGYNRLNKVSNLFVCEILDCRDQKITFGAPLFREDSVTINHRKVFEVADGAAFRREFNKQNLRIIFDHLKTIANAQSELVQVPDGTYIYYEWDGKQWIYHDFLHENPSNQPFFESKKRKESKERLFPQSN